MCVYIGVCMCLCAFRYQIYIHQIKFDDENDKNLDTIFSEVKC